MHPEDTFEPSGDDYKTSSIFRKWSNQFKKRSLTLIGKSWKTHPEIYHALLYLSQPILFGVLTAYIALVLKLKNIYIIDIRTKPTSSYYLSYFDLT